MALYHFDEGKATRLTKRAAVDIEAVLCGGAGMPLQIERNEILMGPVFYLGPRRCLGMSPWPPAVPPALHRV